MTEVKINYYSYKKILEIFNYVYTIKPLARLKFYLRVTRLQTLRV